MPPVTRRWIGTLEFDSGDVGEAWRKECAPSRRGRRRYDSVFSGDIFAKPFFASQFSTRNARNGKKSNQPGVHLRIANPLFPFSSAFSSGYTFVIFSILSSP
jgi:hypothetical protein